MDQNTTSNKLKTNYNWFSDYVKKNGYTNLPVGGKLLQYIIASVTVLYLFLLFYVISNNKNALDKNYLLYMFALIVPLAFMFLVVLSNAKSNNVMIMAASCVFILMMFFISTYFPDGTAMAKGFYYSWFDFEKIPGFTEESSFLASLVMKVILIGCIVIGMSLFYNLFLNQSYRQEGILGFIIYFVFFIPCLVSDFIEYVANEFKTTPNIILVLFVLEIVFLLLYIYLPANILRNSLKNGKILIDGPMFLGNETILAGSDLLKKNDEEVKQLLRTGAISSIENSTKSIYNRNYAISLWFSYNPINKHKDNASLMPIFRYGVTNNKDLTENAFAQNDMDNSKTLTQSELDNAMKTLGVNAMGVNINKNVDSSGSEEIDYKEFMYLVKYVKEIVGVPIIAYLHNDEFSFVFTNNLTDLSDEKYKQKYIQTIHIPPQRWNNIVFNYHNNRVDLFINGSLERTIELTGAIPEYDATMSFIAGSQNNTLHGALCNIRIFSEPLTQSQITQAYNLLKLQNPPVNNLL